jgi:hypothetical protein
MSAPLYVDSVYASLVTTRVVVGLVWLGNWGNMREKMWTWPRRLLSAFAWLSVIEGFVFFFRLETLVASLPIVLINTILAVVRARRKAKEEAMHDYEPRTLALAGFLPEDIAAIVEATDKAAMFAARWPKRVPVSGQAEASQRLAEYERQAWKGLVRLEKYDGPPPMPKS